jgi:hypothetical protein
MFRKALPFSNVVATGMATLDLRSMLGNTIDRIVLKLGGTSFTKAMITGLRIKANGKVIFDDSGSRIDSRMLYRGISSSAAFLTVDFSEIRSKTIKGQKLGSLDTTFGISSLNMEVDISGATAPTLEAWCDLSEPQVDDDGRSLLERGLIGKVLNFTHYFGAAGKFPLNIPYGKQGGSLIKRLHLFGSTVTDAEVKKNGLTVFEAPDAVNDFVQTEFQRSPQANIFHIDFVPDGNMSNVLNAANAQTMEYYATVSGAGNVIVVAELLDPLGNN